MAAAARPEAADLVILSADKDAQQALQELLGRTRDLGIRKISFHPILVAPRHDPEVFGRCQEYLRPFLRSAKYALVALDREGCGRTASRTVIEAEVEQRLRQNGWPDRCAAVVIDPELEVWVWGDILGVSNVLRWSTRAPLDQWLSNEGYL